MKQTQKRVEWTMDNRSLMIVWFVGAVIALTIYALDPGSLFVMLAELVETVQSHTMDLLATLGVRLENLIRASAIALYFVFIVLGFLALRSGLKAKAALLVVSGVFFMLVGSPGGWGVPDNGGHWGAACLLSGAGALTMTRRILLASHMELREGSAGWERKLP
ncbi:hypothetical protein [Granulibacter bethesdensis]|uniref:Uncharacterized protein n=1 Tax=Granulibacter bethesdensis (strain ATCC BAA-1260 / CGDNIH1) TaxID=391165 RepID=Q0BTW2_GRABC|nr:hypothetical protein [Granulibacter bethesdensis]ABI61740.1 Hypothetical protein GbCGDNIH1_0842 [Granulibacter bethesdensis CGDNIH1]AHJ66772.1 Hypothetical protein GbCGDNIH4_0842 [Granulibacter bethesdensis CGDNIH4]AHJ69439.1 Hypothetical protein GbCGDNIH2_0842 [Granulibacter bethesdensis]APH51548.1 Hypothetical protein GbCGDNIH5_0842 [Granulibacter bethesdensis]APH64241.1 Hypothetical protein GbCGDNIH1I4_0842 [Granulibacter bethesdensis]